VRYPRPNSLTAPRSPLSPPVLLSQGDWRGISRHFVQSRTPTQVASHAQKYFIRQNNLNKRKRRSSLFDIVSEAPPLTTSQREAAVAAAATPSINHGYGYGYSYGGIPEAKVAAAARGQAGQVPEDCLGGLSMAFASGANGVSPVPVVPHLGGYNSTGGIPPPASFSMHAAVPPNTNASAAAAFAKAEAGFLGDAAAATVAALSMAGSPAAAAGYAAAAAAAIGSASSPTFPPTGSHPLAGAGTPPGNATAAAGNPYAAMMATFGQMGQVEQIGQMEATGSYPPAASWMTYYHQFMQHMTAAAHQHHQQNHAGFSTGVTFPPKMPLAQQQQQCGAGGAGAVNGGGISTTLCKPTAVHASSALSAVPLAVYGTGMGQAAAPSSKRGDEPANMITA